MMFTISWDMDFLEKVYENALQIELRNRGLTCSAQFPIEVSYEGTIVGEYFADLVVEKKVILELKASETLSSADEYQLINYLKATDVEIGLLLNFDRKPGFKRKIHTKQQSVSICKTCVISVLLSAKNFYI